MKNIRLVLFVMLASSCWGTTYTVGPGTAFTTGTQIYQLIEDLDGAHPVACGDTIQLKAGNYTLGSGLFRLYLTYTCDDAHPLTIQNADATQPLLDFSGHPLDSPCGTVPGSYGVSDCGKGAWQLVGATNVVIKGIHIKGVTSAVDNESAAGIRLVGVSKVTISGTATAPTILELSYSGLFGDGDDVTVEYVKFLNNGYYGNDQAHQYYDTGGLRSIIRYSYWDASGCCIRSDGSVAPPSDGGGGQNIHYRAWSGSIYGNYMTNAQQYPFDMYNPLCSSFNPSCIPSDHTMRLSVYNNVIVGMANPMSVNKQIALFNDNPVQVADTLAIDWQWNTVIMAMVHNYDQYLFSFLTDTTVVTDITGHYANSVLYNIPGWAGTKGLIAINYDNGAAWSLTGNNDWFATTITGNTCGSTYTVGNGSCLISSQSTGTSAAFTNFAGADYSPASSGVFGAADTTQTLKGTLSQIAPMTFVTRSSWNDRGAIEFGSASAKRVVNHQVGGGRKF